MEAMMVVVLVVVVVVVMVDRCAEATVLVE
jgi:hypothetical protein